MPEVSMLQIRFLLTRYSKPHGSMSRLRISLITSAVLQIRSLPMLVRNGLRTQSESFTRRRIWPTVPPPQWKLSLKMLKELIWWQRISGMYRLRITEKSLLLKTVLTAMRKCITRVSVSATVTTKNLNRLFPLGSKRKSQRLRALTSTRIFRCPSDTTLTLPIIRLRKWTKKSVFTGTMRRLRSWKTVKAKTVLRHPMSRKSCRDMSVGAVFPKPLTNEPELGIPSMQCWKISWRRRNMRRQEKAHWLLFTPHPKLSMPYTRQWSRWDFVRAIC